MQQPVALGREGVGNVFKEDQAEGDVLVVAGLHVAAQLVGGGPEGGLEAEIGSPVVVLFRWPCHVCSTGKNSATKRYQSFQ